MQPNLTHNRITLLDSFRCLAILPVMMYHFTYRWTLPFNEFNLYPYEDKFGELFKYGNCGVVFFYIISGFVISFTLESTNTIGRFFTNRFIRLFPPLLLCTIITFIGVNLLDTNQLMPEWHDAKNFLPSLTLVQPDIFSRIFHTKFAWLNSSYWSLWVEIEFYILSAVIYFSNKKKYFTHMLLAALFLAVLNKFIKLACGPSNVLHLPFSEAAKTEILFWLNGPFELTNNIPFFGAGVIFHKLYKEGKLVNRIDKLLAVLVFLSAFMYAKSLAYYSVQILMYAIFWVMVYRSSWLTFLNNRFFIYVGTCSYTLYLIHEPIGIFLLSRYGSYLGSLSVLMPFILIAIAITFSIISFKTYEKTSYRFLKRVLLNNRPKDKNNKLPDTEEHQYKIKKFRASQKDQSFSEL